MEIDPKDPERGIQDFSVESNKSVDKSGSQDFVELLRNTGTPLSPQELEAHFNELVKKLATDVSKAKSQYSSLQREYQQAKGQLPSSSKSDQKSLKMNYLAQLNDVIGSLKDTMEKTVSDSLPDAQINEHETADDFTPQVLQTIKDPTIKEAYSAKFVKDPETPFLSATKDEPSFQSLLSDAQSQMDRMNVDSSATTPHTPSSIQDLESQLSQFGASSSDRNVKALVSVVLSQVKTLEGKGLSLNSIESWAYAAMIGKFTANSEYSIGLGNLTPADQATFKTISGMNQFQGVLTTHGFNDAQVTTLAKCFSDGSIDLKNPNAKTFMEDFYTNLSSGQDPKTAAANAYAKVPASELSPEMNTFIQDLSLCSPKPPPQPAYPPPPATPPADAPPGSIPVSITIPPGKKLSDIYVRVNGPDGALILRPDGTASGTEPYSKDMSKYGYPLSQFNPTAQSGRTITIYIPPNVPSGRIYFSVGKPLIWAQPDIDNASDPDRSTHFTMMEFTSTSSSICLDESAVDGFSGPSISTQPYLHGKPDGVPFGATEDPTTFMNNVKNYINSHVTDPAARQAWMSMFTNIGGVERITAPKFHTDVFGPYFKDYLSKVFIPYIQKNPLYFDINHDKFMIKVSPDGQSLEYCNWDGTSKATLPISQISWKSWLSGSPDGVTKDPCVMQGLSALLMSGMDLKSLGATSPTDDNCLSNTTFVKYEKEGKFFQAMYEGKPMYNVYEHAMHAEGWNAYAYDYDDLFGQDKTITLPVGSGEQAGFSIAMNW